MHYTFYRINMNMGCITFIEGMSDRHTYELLGSLIYIYIYIYIFHQHKILITEQ